MTSLTLYNGRQEGSEKAVAKKERKREKLKYKNKDILRTKKAF